MPGRVWSVSTPLRSAPRANSPTSRCPAARAVRHALLVQIFLEAAEQAWINYITRSGSPDDGGLGFETYEKRPDARRTIRSFVRKDCVTNLAHFRSAFVAEL